MGLKYQVPNLLYILLLIPSLTEDCCALPRLPQVDHHDTHAASNFMLL